MIVKESKFFFKKENFFLIIFFTSNIKQIEYLIFSIILIFYNYKYKYINIHTKNTFHQNKQILISRVLALILVEDHLHNLIYNY